MLLTDLPKQLPLLSRNVAENFRQQEQEQEQGQEQEHSWNHGRQGQQQQQQQFSSDARPAAPPVVECCGLTWGADSH